MNGINNSSPRIKILGDDVSKRIAAGEVIERPNSVVRELLDNSIDAESTEISLYLEGGGCSKIRLIDNGYGMTAKELELCWLQHSTSKISTVEDLNNLSTMGFRGEALSSMSSCARVEICSSIDDCGNANKLTISLGEKPSVTPCPGRKGTIIDISDLFYNLPARKRFLKRPGTEGTMCKKTFLEKAVPFPDITFKFFNEGIMKIFLPAGTLKERVSAAYPKQFPISLCDLVEDESEGTKVTLIACQPSVHRKDRQFIPIFVNKRRIDEYGFVQAVEYGYSGTLPGGMFPCCAVFIETDASLVDFNIHPAKREARFRQKEVIHHLISRTLKNHLTKYSTMAISPFSKEENINQADLDFTSTVSKKEYNNNSSYATTYNRPETIKSVGKTSSNSEWSDLLSKFPKDKAKVNEDENDFSYLGQIFKTFLLIEKGDKLLIIDQHAAHERILFDEVVAKGLSPQELLFPIEVDCSEGEDKLLTETCANWQECGVTLTKKSNNLWLVTTLPESAMNIKSNMIDLLKGESGDTDTLKKELFATIVCRMAIKEGDILEANAAIELIKKTLKLPIPRCPHGRPVWTAVTRDFLYESVGRTI